MQAQTSIEYLLILGAVLMLSASVMVIFMVFSQNYLTEFVVTPADDFSTTGQPGVHFTQNKSYNIINLGKQSIEWSVANTQDWVSITSSTGTTSGTLAIGDPAGVTITVSINSSAESLPAGSYNDTIAFINSTSHFGDTTRSVNLTIQ